MLPNPRISVKEARRMQKALSGKVILKDSLPEMISYVAGVDAAYLNNFSFGAVTVFNYESMELVEKQVSKRRVYFPYIPTLLSFRELHPIIAAVKKLKPKPDIFLVDGHGLAHPMRLGLAAHFGLVLDAPAIGVAKNLLCGEVVDSGEESWKPIIYDGEIVGAAVSTKNGKKPLYVSVGHKISLESAIRIVLHCIKNYNVPEPLREAHITAQKAKKIEAEKLM